MTNRVSRYFTLDEAQTTSFRQYDNTIPYDYRMNLDRLCLDHLDKIRERFGPLRINSLYRSPEVNAAVGGSPSSAHLEARAADLVPLAAGVSIAQIVRWVRDESGLPFDQIIDEKGKGPGWLHYGISRIGRTPRRQALRMRDGIFTPYVDEVT